MDSALGPGSPLLGDWTDVGPQLLLSPLSLVQLEQPSTDDLASPLLLIPLTPPTPSQPSERVIKLFHLPLFALIVRSPPDDLPHSQLKPPNTIISPHQALSSVVSLAISASLVKFYNDHQYPSGAYRDRIRILLVASVWTLAISSGWC